WRGSGGGVRPWNRRRSIGIWPCWCFQRSHPRHPTGAKNWESRWARRSPGEGNRNAARSVFLFWWRLGRGDLAGAAREGAAASRRVLTIGERSGRDVRQTAESERTRRGG